MSEIHSSSDFVYYDEILEPDCWICVSSQSTRANPMLHGICRCIGSTRAVHQECINELVLHYKQTHCSICNSRYLVVCPGEVSGVIAQGLWKTLYHYFFSPLLRRTFWFVVWFFYCHVMMPFTIGSVYYRDLFCWLGKCSMVLAQQQQQQGKGSSGSPFSASVATVCGMAPYHSISSPVPTWRWTLFNAWLFGIGITLTIRIIVYTYAPWVKSFPDAFPTPPPAAPPQEEEEGIPEAVAAVIADRLRREEGDDPQPNDEQGTSEDAGFYGIVSTVYDFFDSVEKFVLEYSIMKELIASQLLIGLIVACVLRSRRWGYLSLVGCALCFLWEFASPLRSLNVTPESKWSNIVTELVRLKPKFSKLHVQEMYVMTVYRIALITLTCGLAVFWCHVLFAPFFYNFLIPESSSLFSLATFTTSFHHAINHLSVFRLWMYIITGFFASVLLSLLDSHLIAPLFEHGVELYIFRSFHSDENPKDWVDALASRVVFVGILRITIATVWFSVIFFAALFGFFAIPLGLWFGSRRMLWGDSLETLSVTSSTHDWSMGTLYGTNTSIPVSGLTLGTMQHYPSINSLPSAVFTAASVGSSAVIPLVQRYLDRALNVTDELPLTRSDLRSSWKTKLVQGGQLCRTVWSIVRHMEYKNEELFQLTSKPDVKKVVDSASQLLPGEVSSSPFLPCQAVFDLAITQELESVLRLFEKSWLHRVLDKFQCVRWFSAKTILSYARLSTWMMNVLMLVGIFATLDSLFSLPVYRLQLRQLYSCAKVLGKWCGLTKYLFSNEKIAILQDFLDGDEDVEMVPLVPVPAEVLLSSRVELMAAGDRPDRLGMRRFFFFLGFYSVMVLVLWEIPLLGAVLLTGVTVQLVPLSLLSTITVMLLWRPKYFLFGPLQKSVMLCGGLLFLAVYAIVRVPLELMTTNWEEVAALSYMYSKHLLPRVVPYPKEPLGSRGIPSQYK